MKLRLKIVAGVVVVAVALVIFVLPLVSMVTRHEFFDLNSGRLRVRWATLGIVWSDRVTETAYSRFLRDLTDEELPPDWRATHSKQIGLVTRRLHHEYAKLPNDAATFVSWVELQEKMDQPEKRERLKEFRTLVRERSPEEAHQYVVLLLDAKSADPRPSPLRGD